MLNSLRKHSFLIESVEERKERGFRAMQFNFVIATNERAVRFWQAMGFAIVGRLPGRSRTRRTAMSTRW